MSEPRYAKEKKSKAPLIILIIVLVLVAAAVVGVILYMNSVKLQPQTDETTQPQTTEQQTSISEQSSQTEQPQQSQQSQQGSTAQQSAAVSSDAESIVVPTVSNEEQGEMFNATFTPSYAVDSLTGADATLKDVFGTSYTGGAYTFNSDGTFSESISLTSDYSGAYSVQGDNIVLTYTNDKNIIFTVTKWNGNEPEELLLKDYGGYDVYFS